MLLVFQLSIFSLPVYDPYYFGHNYGVFRINRKILRAK
jgi:hypothetical protein